MKSFLKIFIAGRLANFFSGIGRIALRMPHRAARDGIRVILLSNRHRGPYVIHENRYFYPLCHGLL